MRRVRDRPARTKNERSAWACSAHLSTTTGAIYLGVSAGRRAGNRKGAAQRRAEPEQRGTGRRYLTFNRVTCKIAPFWERNMPEWLKHLAVLSAIGVLAVAVFVYY